MLAVGLLRIAVIQLAQTLRKIAFNDFNRNATVIIRQALDMTTPVKPGAHLRKGDKQISRSLTLKKISSRDRLGR